MIQKLLSKTKERYMQDGIKQILPFFIEIFMCNGIKSLYRIYKRMGKPNFFSMEINDLYLMGISKYSRGLDDDLLLFQKREPQSTDFLKTLLKKDMKILDIGAHAGYYALLESMKCNKVIAVEPVPENYDRLTYNIHLNNFKNIFPFNCAVGDKDVPEFQMYLHNSKSNLHSCIKHSTGYSEKSISVPMYTVETLLKMFDMSTFDIIRMDIEGYEYEVVSGMSNYLREYNPILFIEMHPIHMDKDKVYSMLNMLKSFGYEIIGIFNDTDDMNIFNYRWYRNIFNSRYELDFSAFTIDMLMANDDFLNGYYNRLEVFFAKK